MYRIPVLEMTTGELATRMEIPDAFIQSVSTTVATAVKPIYEQYLLLVGKELGRVESALNLEYPQSNLTSNLPLVELAPATVPLVLFVIGIMLCSIFSFIIRSRYRLLSIVHNLLMMALSTYMVVGIAVTANACGYRLWNNGVGKGPFDRRLAKLIWLFFFSKCLEFGDTALMALKGNFHQLSFLHLYHHVTIYVIWYIGARSAPGGEAYFSAALNSGVHVFMYGYYLLSALFPEGRVRNVLQRWKGCVTYLQMTQFAVNVAQAVYDLHVVPRPQLRYPATLMQLLFWYMLSLLLLFALFLLGGGKKRSGNAKQSQKGRGGKGQVPNAKQTAAAAATTPVSSPKAAAAAPAAGSRSSQQPQAKVSQAPQAKAGQAPQLNEGGKQSKKSGKK